MTARRSRALLLLALVAILGAAAFGDSIDKPIAAALSRVADKYWTNVVLSYDTFTYGDSGIAGPFSRYLEDRITSAISSPELSVKCTLFVHDALDNMDQSFKDVFGGQIGALNVRQVLRGKYFDRGDSISVSLELIDFSTGNLIGKEEFGVAKADVPREASLVPLNYDAAVNIMRDMGDILAGRGNGFIIRATTTKGNGAAYRDGEKFAVSVAANRDCFIKIYQTNVKGETKLIFPEPGYSNFIKARTLFTIPDADYPVEFVVERPFGVESLKIVASTRQFDLIEPTFVPLSPKAVKSDFMSQDIGSRRVQGKNAEASAEASVIYTTIPK
jgi:hypothetical protein